MGLVKNSNISKNSVDNAGVCGVGAWWNSSWQKNTISDNIINKSPASLVFFYLLRDYIPKPSQLFFTDNNFKNNKLTNPTQYKDYIPRPVIIDYHATDSSSNVDLVKYNNFFFGNDFGMLKSPFFNPGKMIVDGGKNICLQGTESDFPLTCEGVQPNSRTAQQNSVQDVNKTLQLIESMTRQSKEDKNPAVSLPSHTSNLFDLNQDGVVNSIDASRFIQKWQTNKFDSTIDFDHNGKINSLDWGLMKKGLQ